mmetsp:Transcript_13514/g.11570  ORF Transcript_13514/g.11570 Transcript_13514/m.11570 type:complete len:167 (-) Transcript_13514:1129-1629(-)
MGSEINESISFKYWWEPCQWFGSFKLDWLFVKTLPENKLKSIKNGNTPILKLSNFALLENSVGISILKLFKEHQEKESIFSYFEYMDRREDYIRYQRDNDPSFEENFNKCCLAHNNKNALDINFEKSSTTSETTASSTNEYDVRYDPNYEPRKTVKLAKEFVPKSF